MHCLEMIETHDPPSIPIHMSKILQKETSDPASGLALHPLKGTHSTMATRMSCDVYLDPKSVSCHENPRSSTHHFVRWLKGSQTLWVQIGADVKREPLLQDDQESHTTQMEPIQYLSQQRTHVRKAKTSRSISINYSECS